MNLRILKRIKAITPLLCAVAIMASSPKIARADLEIVFPLLRDGAANLAIHVAPEVMQDDHPVHESDPFPQREAEMHRRRLRESVNDLSHYLKKMIGVPVTVLQRAPVAEDKMKPIYIGQYARERFGALAEKTTFRQGFRISATSGEIGLLGETDEATSYAIYTLLDRLGCRWFMPGEMGECIPRAVELRLPGGNVFTAPDTAYRGIWYGDDAFKRRNRLGGFLVSAGHALESYLTEQQREEHPEWRATIDGKPHPIRLKWSNPEVSNAVADAIIATLDKTYTPSVSLSPADGAEFDQTDDTKLDAGDWDASMNQVSITDRYVNFCNRIAERVTKKYPDVRFGFLAYVQYTRPPVREKLHPNLIPQIAPITYCRAHAMTDANCPSRPQLKTIVEGWGRVAPGRVSYYNYMFQLAEVTVPYPMMHQMSEELPILYANGVAFWQPETIANFEEVLPGMWLSLRMAWDNKLKPQAVLDEFFTRFYGASEKPMRRYWQTIDNAWTHVAEHAGGGWGHLRRFTPEVMRAAREAMDDALSAAAAPWEYRRVKMQDESLRQFERFMGLRRDLAEGRLADLDLRSTEWLGTQLGLANEYSENYGFSKAGWTPLTIGGAYFKTFFEATYLDAARIAKEYSIVGNPVREWKYQVAEKLDGEALGWQITGFDDAAWKTTDIAVETWFDLGLSEYYGSVWYRQQVTLPQIPPGKKVFLWIAAADDRAKVFVNGQHIPYVDAKGESAEAASGYVIPFSFDITAAAQPEAANVIAIVGTRRLLNELGTGGLLGPVYVYLEK